MLSFLSVCVKRNLSTHFPRLNREADPREQCTRKNE